MVRLIFLLRITIGGYLRLSKSRESAAVMRGVVGRGVGICGELFGAVLLRWG